MPFFFFSLLSPLDTDLLSHTQNHHHLQLTQPLSITGLQDLECPDVHEDIWVQGTA